MIECPGAAMTAAAGRWSGREPFQSGMRCTIQLEQHDYNPEEPEEEQEDPQKREDRPDSGDFPYEDFYSGHRQADSGSNRQRKPRQKHSRQDRRARNTGSGKRDQLLVPLLIFACLLVVACGAILAVSLADGSEGGSSALQLQSADAVIESSGSDSAGSQSEIPSPGEDTEEEEAVQEAEAEADDTPVVTLGSGTVLTISETPDYSESIESENPDGSLSLQEIYEKVIPSVVSITSTLSDGAATGTGIIMSEDGYIITNYHVIEDALSLSVLLQDDTEYTAALVGGDETSDLAVLKIDAEDLTPAEFGDSDKLRVGDEVVAIGDPLGTELRGTMTNGIISAINRDLVVDDRTMTLIQTNAALNSGNSGGPLINCYGQVIGINTMKISSYYSAVEGLGFAIPISSAKPIIDELIESGYVSGRPAIGITILSGLSDTVRAYYDYPEGVIVQSVQENSYAAAQGLQPGDVITAMDGVAVTTADELQALLKNYNAGDTVRLTIWRDGETIDLGITLMDAHELEG